MPILGVIASAVQKGIAFGLGPNYGPSTPYQLARSWSMQYGNGLYLFQSTGDNKIYTSSNTTSWTGYTQPTRFDTQTQIGFDGTYFWNTGWGGTPSVFYVFYSTNGASWTTAQPATANLPADPTIGSFWAGKGRFAGKYYVRANGTGAYGMLTADSLTGTWTFNSNGGTTYYWGCKNNGTFTMMTQNGGNNIAYATNPAGSWNVATKGTGGDSLSTGVSGSRMFTDYANGVTYSTNGASWTQVSVAPGSSSTVSGACSGNGTGVISTGWYQQRYWYSTNNGNSWAEASLVVQTGSQAQTNSEYAGSYIWLCANGVGLWRMDPSTPQTATQISITNYNITQVSGAQWSVTNGAGVVLRGAQNSANSDYPIIIRQANNTSTTVTTPAGLTNANGSGYQATWDGSYFYFVPYNSTTGWASADGTTWSSFSLVVGSTVLTANNSKVISYSQGNSTFYISNLYPSISWSSVNPGVSMWWSDKDSSNLLWLLLDGNPSIYVQNSASSTSFTSYTTPGRDGLTGSAGTWYGYKCYSGGGKNFLIGNTNGSLEIKNGSVTGNGGWTNFATPFTAAVEGVAYGDGYWLIYTSAKIYKTSDFVNYTLLDKYPTNDNWQLSVRTGNASGSVIYDGSKWSFINNNSTQVYTQV